MSMMQGAQQVRGCSDGVPTASALLDVRVRVRVRIGVRVRVRVCPPQVPSSMLLSKKSVWCR